MNPEKVLKEIAEVFVKFVHQNPDVPLLLHVRVGDMRLELQYRAAEVSDNRAVAFGLRGASAVSAARA